MGRGDQHGAQNVLHWQLSKSDVNILQILDYPARGDSCMSPYGSRQLAALCSP